MRDADIREALWQRLTEQHAGDRGAKLFDELGVCEGRVRIDLAVVDTRRLHGFEIKSDQDTLARLDEQQRVYSKVFDQVTIVTHGAHMEHVFERVPSWWGVTQAIGIGATKVAFIERRSATDNPGRDAKSIVQLLWRDEVLAILARRGLDRGVRSKARKHAWKRAATELPLPDLCDEVRAALRRRRWR